MWCWLICCKDLCTFHCKLLLNRRTVNDYLSLLNHGHHTFACTATCKVCIHLHSEILTLSPCSAFNFSQQRVFLNASLCQQAMQHEARILCISTACCSSGIASRSECSKWTIIISWKKYSVMKWLVRNASIHYIPCLQHRLAYVFLWPSFSQCLMPSWVTKYIQEGKYFCIWMYG